MNRVRMAALPRVSILLPLYNEKESIVELCERVRAVLLPLEPDFEILFVDDGSTDGSAALMDRLYDSDSRVRILRFRRNFGKAAALAAGFAAARGEIIVTLDGDLQDLPEEIPRFLVKIAEGADLVSGWKYPRRDPIGRRLASRCYNLVTRLVSGVPLHDMNCGFKAYRREVAQSLKLYGELHRYIPLIAHSLGFRIVELKVTHAPRLHGRSKYGWWRFFSGFFDLFTVMMLTRYRARPLHIFGMIGFLACLLGGALTLYLVVLRMLGQYLSNRPLFYFALSILIVGVQMVFFGLLAEMLAHSRDVETYYSVREFRRHEEAEEPPRPAAAAPASEAGETR
jgi:glycosyltransferase involved in cell wall biosynthesis